MNNRIFIFLLICAYLIILNETEMQAQLTIPTNLKSVSLSNRKDSISIYWDLIPAQGISKYSVSHPDPRDLNAWQVIDSTNNPFDNKFTFIYSPVKEGPLSLRMRAEDSSYFHYRWGNIHTLNFLKVSSDTCNFSFTLRWTGYKGWGDSLTYQVIVKEGSRQEKTYAIKTYEEDSLSYLLPQSDTLYCFVIKAVKTDGLISYSNQDTVSMHIPKVPAYIYADYIAAANNGISLSFSLDPVSGLTKYILFRSESESGPFSPVQNYPFYNGSVLNYTDHQALPTELHYYKLVVLNSCGTYIKESGITGNIVLNARVTESVVNLDWNKHPGWNGRIGTDSLMRSTPGGGWEFLAAFPASDSSFTDKLDSLAYRSYSDKICYYIKSSSDSLNPSGVNEPSISNAACVDLPSAIKIPNAFTPNSDGKNDEFTIRFDFIPDEYLLKIFDRNGNILFQTTNPTDFWNGKDGRGKFVPQGLYVYYLRYSFQGQGIKEARGTISVLYP